jgi:hypothetical protein
MTPGSSSSLLSSLSMPTRVFAVSQPARHSQIIPQIRSTRGLYFEATLVHNSYGLPVCSPPWTDQAGIHAQPPGTFTSRLPTGRSPFPSLDITTTATGLLCRRDSHPLECQLASLHWLNRAILVRRTIMRFLRCLARTSTRATTRPMASQKLGCTKPRSAISAMGIWRPRSHLARPRACQRRSIRHICPMSYAVFQSDQIQNCWHPYRSGGEHPCLFSL